MIGSRLTNSTLWSSRGSDVNFLTTQDRRRHETSTNKGYFIKQTNRSSRGETNLLADTDTDIFHTNKTNFKKQFNKTYKTSQHATLQHIKVDIYKVSIKIQSNMRPHQSSKMRHSLPCRFGIILEHGLQVCQVITLRVQQTPHQVTPVVPRWNMQTGQSKLYLHWLDKSRKHNSYNYYVHSCLKVPSRFKC